MSFVIMVRKTAAEFTAENRTLALNEIGVETDVRGGIDFGSGKWKIGNGRTPWRLLPYTDGSGVHETVDGIAATGTLTASLSGVTHNATIAVNGVTFTFKDTSQASVGVLTAVQIGFTPADNAKTIALSIAAVLNASVHADISVASYQAAENVVYITYDTPGAAGNAFTLADSSDGAVVRSAATLEGGSDGLSQDVAGVDAAIASAVDAVATLGSHATDNTSDGNYIPGLPNLGGVTQWDAVYLNGSSQWVKADANGAGAFPARGLAMATALTTVVVSVFVRGTVRHDAWTWTPGGAIYLSGSVGELTQTPPAVSGDNVQQVGYALTADIAFFDFNSTFVELA